MKVKDLLEYLREQSIMEIYKKSSHLISFYTCEIDYINPDILNAEVEKFKPILENRLRIYIKAITKK